jgi:uncharacterized protein YqeY
MTDLKARVHEAVKVAMRARERVRLGTLRLIEAEIKQYEVDQRQPADDAVVLQVLERMLKQRRDSIAQFEKGGRADLAAVEAAEMQVITEFMPEPLTEDELQAEIATAIAQAGATSLRDMGGVMAVLRERIRGRADMAIVSQQVRAALTGAV